MMKLYIYLIEKLQVKQKTEDYFSSKSVSDLCSELTKVFDSTKKGEGLTNFDGNIGDNNAFLAMPKYDIFSILRLFSYFPRTANQNIFKGFEGKIFEDRFGKTIVSISVSNEVSKKIYLFVLVLVLIFFAILIKDSIPMYVIGYLVLIILICSLTILLNEYTKYNFKKKFIEYFKLKLLPNVKGV